MSLTNQVRARRLGATAIAAVVALIACLMLPAAALADEPYLYTVRIFGGNEGVVRGQDPYVISGLDAGDEITLEKGWVSLNDGSKYYVKGFRLGGEDAMHAESFVVNHDMDFVVAYGVQGQRVSYTLRYVAAGSGKQLASPQTYHGNKGDKPVAAYQHIPGYRPRYRNITATLGDEGTNVWTFEYVPVSSESTSEGSAETTITYRNTNSSKKSTSLGGTPETHEADATESKADADESKADADDATTESVESVDDAPTQEMLDLDAAPAQQDEEPEVVAETASAPVSPVVLGVVAAAVLAGVGGILYYRHRQHG